MKQYFIAQVPSTSGLEGDKKTQDKRATGVGQHRNNPQASQAHHIFST